MIGIGINMTAIVNGLKNDPTFHLQDYSVSLFVLL